MSQSPQKLDGTFSLRGEIQKRKTQELQRAIQEKQRTQTIQTSEPALPQAAPRHMTHITPVGQRRTTQTIVPPTPARQLTRPRKVALLVLGMSVLIIAICSGTLLLTTNSAVTPTPTLRTLPTVTAQDVVNYFKSAGVPITTVRELVVVPETWAATQEFEVEMRRGSDKGHFLVLSYAVPQKKITDMFRVNTNKKFKDWQVMTISNVILLTAPEMSEAFRSELTTHLNQYLIVPLYQP